ncbi:MAG: hypothetical protein HYT75_00955 [Deltaproteobacteria bacterium]|nr:hypothetical protein [Deltaproteobacteria bacterium]MBI2341575.1 hypothetical protein [Deltaproteobacteria bacterium]
MYKEIILSSEEAFLLYSQLSSNDIEDGFPTAVELSIEQDETFFFVEDIDAKKFISQFLAPEEKNSYSLFINTHLPATVKIEDIQKNPYLGMFFGRLAQAEGSEEQNCELYFRNKGLTFEEIDSLIKIARNTEQLTASQNPTEEDYSHFMKALSMALSQQGSIGEVATAFENLKNKNAKGFSPIQEQPGLFYERPLILIDLACQILSLIAINDYEHLLRANFTNDQLSGMPPVIMGPLSVKPSIIDGNVVSVYDGNEAAEKQRSALYDVSVNAIFYSNKLFRTDFFEPDSKSGDIPATVVNHEIVHAWQDMEKRSMALKLKEAEAHFTDTFYDRLKNGKTRYDELHKKNREVYMPGWKLVLERMETVAGLKLTEEDFLDLLDIRSDYISVIEDMLTRLQRGKKLPEIDMKTFGERYAESESVLSWVGPAFNTVTIPGGRFDMIRREGNLPILDIMGASKKPDGTLDLKPVEIRLPQDENKFEKTVFSTIDAMKTTTDYPRIKAINAIHAVVIYLVYMHKRHPGKVNAKEVFENVLMPFANRLTDGLPPPFTLGI